jgi:hypothetical protein
MQRLNKKKLFDNGVFGNTGTIEFKSSNRCKPIAEI